MTNKNNIISFKSNPYLVSQLDNLQVFFGFNTRSKLIQEMLFRSIMDVYQKQPPANLSPKQKKAYLNIRKTIDEVQAEIRLDLSGKVKRKRVKK